MTGIPFYPTAAAYYVAQAYAGALHVRSKSVDGWVVTIVGREFVEVIDVVQSIKHRVIYNQGAPWYFESWHMSFGWYTGHEGWPPRKEIVWWGFLRYDEIYTLCIGRAENWTLLERVFAKKVNRMREKKKIRMLYAFNAMKRLQLVQTFHVGKNVLSFGGIEVPENTML